jgi:hypothetical protein
MTGYYALGVQKEEGMIWPDETPLTFQESHNYISNYKVYYLSKSHFFVEWDFSY